MINQTGHPGAAVARPGTWMGRARRCGEWACRGGALRLGHDPRCSLDDPHPSEVLPAPAGALGSGRRRL